MEQNYAEMRVIKYSNNSMEDELEYLSLYPDISKIMEKSRDPEELKYYWMEWYTELGRQNKKKYFDYVELRNEAAKLNSETLISRLQMNKIYIDSFRFKSFIVPDLFSFIENINILYIVNKTYIMR